MSSYENIQDTIYKKKVCTYIALSSLTFSQEREKNELITTYC